MKFTFGSDPEFMVAKNGVICSAIGVVPGTKKKRKKIKGHEFYYDNVLAECAIKPADNKEEVINNFRECFQTYAELIKPHKLIVKPYVVYPRSILLHEDAREAGCKDELCPYTFGTMIPPQMEIKYETNRSAGGHIHLGYDGHVQTEIVENKIRHLRGAWDVARMMDIFVGIPSLLMDDEEDAKKRRRLFGYAGRYRKTPYGIEYRTLSNFWLKSPKLVETVFDLCHATIKAAEDPDIRKRFWDYDEDKLFSGYAPDAYQPKYDLKGVRDCINECKVNQVVYATIDAIREFLPPQLTKDLLKFRLTSSKLDFNKEWEIK